MSFRRYIAPTSRDAMAQVRQELGDDAVILLSKRVGDEYEVVAAAPHAMERLVETVPVARVTPRRIASPASPPVPVTAQRPLTRPGESFQEYVRRQSQANATARTQQAATAAASYRAVARAEAAEDDDEEIWKPTTFHVPQARAGQRVLGGEAAREAKTPRVMHEVAPPLAPARMAQRAPQSTPAQSPFQPLGASARLPTRRAVAEVPPPPAVFRRRAEVNEAAHPASVANASEGDLAATSVSVAAETAPGVMGATGVTGVPGVAGVAGVAGTRAPTAETTLIEELQAMRAQLQQQLTNLSSTVAASKQELQARISHVAQVAQQHMAARGNAQTNAGRVMTRLLTSGFSPEVARKVALHTSAQATLAELETWLQDVIALNLKVAGPDESIVEVGGAYALVGPTGVGKTTTVAKLAAQFAVRYGAGALGLITLDAYRVGAHEQLRTYGRILGAPVHLAQDGGTLRELMVSMQNKRLVLIDTCGVSQRDGRLNEVLSMLDAGTQGVPEAMHIKRLLLANAASHAETLDDAARAWRAPECAGSIFTKLDEAARIGGAIDMALRYKLRVLGVTNGQRVPEDWHAASARVLTHLALRPGADAFALAESEAMALVEPRSVALH